MNQTASTKDTFLEKINAWSVDPNLFVYEALKGIPDTWQVEALAHVATRPRTLREYTYIYTRAIEWYKTHPKKTHGEKNLALAEKWTKQWIKKQYHSVFKRVTVKSGHGVGKSTCQAWVLLWTISCFYPLKGGSTAPTSHQLEDVLWSEISTWFDKMPAYLRKNLLLKDLRLENKAKPKESFIVGKTARKETPEALQGLHKENTVIVVDECSGVHDAIFESSEGIMTAESCHAFLGSNPTRTSGFFYETHTKTKSLWHCITVSCFDSPRVSQDYITNCIKRYGKDSNRYRVRVKGLFPRTDEDAVCPLYLIEAAQERDVEGIDAPIVWGLDVARFGGDRNALSARKGNMKLGKTEWWNKMDTMATAGKVILKFNELKKEDRPEDIVVDVNGVGAGVLDKLREAGLPARGVNAHETAPTKEKFFRWRDELWWKTRQWLEAMDCKLPQVNPDDMEDSEDQFAEELSTPKYVVLSSGKIQVERKEDVKKRTNSEQSPDLAESFMLTFASYKSKHQTKELHYPSLGIV